MDIGAQPTEKIVFSTMLQKSELVYRSTIQRTARDTRTRRTLDGQLGHHDRGACPGVGKRPCYPRSIIQEGQEVEDRRLDQGNGIELEDHPYDEDGIFLVSIPGRAA